VYLISRSSSWNSDNAKYLSFKMKFPRDENRSHLSRIPRVANTNEISLSKRDASRPRADYPSRSVTIDKDSDNPFYKERLYERGTTRFRLVASRYRAIRDVMSRKGPARSRDPRGRSRKRGFSVALSRLSRSKP